MRKTFREKFKFSYFGSDTGFFDSTSERGTERDRETEKERGTKRGNQAN